MGPDVEKYGEIAQKHDGETGRVDPIVMSICEDEVVMTELNLYGSIRMEIGKHTVEYEPGAMVGLSTLFLRLRDGGANVPIHYSDIDDVILMLQRGKNAIESFEQ
jgi:hypothetical protein